MNPSTLFARVDELLAQPVSDTRDAELNRVLTDAANLAGFDVPPIVLVTRHSHIGAVRFLLERGADPNTTIVGRPVLHVAVEGDAIEIAQLLIDFGCDVNRVDRYESNSSAWRVALLRRNNAMLALLVRHGAVIKPDEYVNTRRISNDEMRQLLIAGLDVESAAVPEFSKETGAGSTDAAVELIRLLLAHGSQMSNHSASFRRCNCPRIGALFRAANIAHCSMHPVLARSGEIDKHLEWARRELNRERLALIGARATQICIALQALELPALLLVMIIDVACQPLANCVSMHLKWRLVAAVKHHRAL